MDALTPAGPFVAADRGSLIHDSLTSDHAVSNHLRFSAGRIPLPQRRQHYFVRGSRRLASRLAKTADRIEFTLWRLDRHGVTAWSFSSRCAPPGGMVPMQFRSDTGPTVSARSGTFTLLSMSALRRTSGGLATAPNFPLRAGEWWLDGGWAVVCRRSMRRSPERRYAPAPRSRFLPQIAPAFAQCGPGLPGLARFAV